MDDYRADIQQFEEGVILPIKQSINSEIETFCAKLHVSKRELFSKCKVTRMDRRDYSIVTLYYENSYLKITTKTYSLSVKVSTFIGER